MADTDDTKQEKEQEKQEEKKKKSDKQEEKKNGKQEDAKPEAGDKKSLVSRLLPGLIIAVVVISFAGTGFTLGRLFTGSDVPESSEQDKSAQVEDADDSTVKGWYYDLEPVIANLDVPDVTRYVRASLILEVSSDMNQSEGTAFFDEKKPLLTNWLTVYLASLSIDDIRGESSLKRIQAQILDAFNEKLFPDSKPKIKHILFKEFAVQ